MDNSDLKIYSHRLPVTLPHFLQSYFKTQNTLNTIGLGSGYSINCNYLFLWHTDQLSCEQMIGFWYGVQYRKLLILLDSSCLVSDWSSSLALLMMDICIEKLLPGEGEAWYKSCMVKGKNPLPVSSVLFHFYNLTDHRALFYFVPNRVFSHQWKQYWHNYVMIITQCQPRKDPSVQPCNTALDNWWPTFD